jgi:uncharacterized membrane protein YecN with MAPEG domain
VNIGVICTALLGMLLFGLGLYISILRFRYGPVIGHNANPLDPLHRAVRAHGNTAQYAPFFGLLFLWFATRPVPNWIEFAIGAATGARFLLVGGLLWGKSLDRPNPARFLGALLTYLCGFALAVGLMV